MRQGTPLFLEADTVSHLKWLAAQMRKRLGRGVSISEAVEWLVRQHWKSTMKRQAMKREKEKTFGESRAIG